MLALLKTVDGPWELVRGYLRTDLEHIEAAINQRWGSIFSQSNTILPAALGSISHVGGVSGILPIVSGGTNSGTPLSGSGIMISNGSQIVQGALGTATTVLHGNAAGAPTYSAVSLAADVSGRLPYANVVAATAASLILGRGAAGGGGDWQELTIGTGLVITGTVLSAAGTSVVFQTTITLTDAQARALNATPVTILIAQGAKTVIVPLRMTCVSDVSAAFNSANSITLRYIGGGTSIMPSVSMTLNATGKKYAVTVPTSTAQGSATGFENTGMEVVGSIGLAGGSTVAGTNVSLLWMLVTYP